MAYTVHLLVYGGIEPQARLSQGAVLNSNGEKNYMWRLGWKIELFTITTLLELMILINNDTHLRFGSYSVLRAFVATLSSWKGGKELSACVKERECLAFLVSVSVCVCVIFLACSLHERVCCWNTMLVCFGNKLQCYQQKLPQLTHVHTETQTVPLKRLLT